MDYVVEVSSTQNYQVFVNRMPIMLADLNNDEVCDMVDVLLTMQQRTDLSRGQIEQLLQQIDPYFIGLN
ncbi:hypothetical protein PAECIP111891_04047 [Paenibacillus allorhizoplanae]|uniref:Uncharacterized protein n=2 Tax=Paenibacillus allorhizoplanae TaxID=2905648 RepID=A0ABM9CIY1_9BACL|nr:hypothetical protein PAECIP111891_04047 [Paenibacillus allorhizoplanae]